MNKVTCTLLSLLVVALVLGVGTAAAQDEEDGIFIGYFANANASGVPSAYLRLSNDGGSGPAGSPTPSVCAAIYVFDNAEEMVECCSCEVTPDGYLDLSVNSSLLSNILNHGTKPTRGIVEVVGNYPYPGPCNPTSYETEPGIKGWLSHVQKGATAGTFSLTETPLTDAFNSDGGEELDYDLEETCSMVQSLGSGTGVCSCADAGD